jgi:hypothetical protein
MYLLVVPRPIPCPTYVLTVMLLSAIHTSSYPTLLAILYFLRTYYLLPILLVILLFTCLIYCTPAILRTYILPYLSCLYLLHTYVLPMFAYNPLLSYSFLTFLLSLLTVRTYYLLVYMYLLLYPGLSFVRTYCLTVIPLSLFTLSLATAAYNPLLFFTY